MAANIYIYCPSGVPGRARRDLEEELEEFFGDAAEDSGAGSGEAGFNLDFDLEEGEDPHAWADRLKLFLATIGVRRGTHFDVFPDGWEPGMEWRRVEVFGEDLRRTDLPGRQQANRSIHSMTMNSTYFDTFLSAVEKISDRRGVLGDDELVFPPNLDYGYDATPRNALTFGTMGVDGVHYAILKVDGEVTDESPVIQVGPMDFSEPYLVLGDSFVGYLAAACGVSCKEMELVFKTERAAGNKLVPFLKKRFAHSRLYDQKRLRKLDRFLKMIEPKP